MESKMNKPQEYINTLLDIERFSGESRKRLGPIMLFLTVAFGPVLMYGYFFIGVIPVTWASAFFVVHITRSAMVILGQEKRRVELYKQQLYDEYSSILEFMSIKTVHSDGLIEYKGNKVAYLMVTKNSGNFDTFRRAQQISKIISSIDKTYTIDILCQNILDSDDLSSRYAGVSFFVDREAAKDYLEIIDFNRQIIKEDSLVSRVVFVISGRRKDHKGMRQSIESVLNSDDSRAFRSIEIADAELATEIISRDIDSFVDFADIQRRQYSEGKYYGSSVKEYDYDDTVSKKEVKEERGFMQ